MADERTDAALLREIGARTDGARAAEAELCRRFGERIRLYGLRHLRDPDRARDLVQEVLVAVLEAARADRIGDLENVHRFVLGVCRNTTLRMRERDGRATAAGDALVELAGAAPEPARIEMRALLACLAGLEQRAREILVLSFQEDRDAQEIARVLAMTPGNVRVVRHRALASVRRCLEGARGGHA